MKRDVILSAVIAALAAGQPFWEWGSAAGQAVGTLGIGVLAFMVLLATEEERGNHR